MRRSPFLLCALTLLAAPVSAPAAGPGTGGSAAPSANGGMSYGQPLWKVRRARHFPSRPVASEFTVAPGTVEAGRPTTFAFRVDGRMRTVRVRIELTAAGASAPANRIRVGYRRTGVRHEYIWTPAAGELRAGEYAVTLKAFDDAGHGLRRSAAASGRGSVVVQVPPPPAIGGVFPIQGAYSFGGEESRFGAARDGHVHQGQDVAAAEGTPLVAAVAATVTWVAYQANGAGHYVVMRAADGRDLVFMHLKEGSVTVTKGAVLAAGAQFAQVGNTGSSSGPHLHFEIWPDGWYSSAESRPIDPLPQLMAWAGTR